LVFWLLDKLKRRYSKLSVLIERLQTDISLFLNQIGDIKYNVASSSAQSGKLLLISSALEWIFPNVVIK
jgi:hypothetical protein